MIKRIMTVFGLASQWLGWWRWIWRKWI